MVLKILLSVIASHLANGAQISLNSKSPLLQIDKEIALQKDSPLVSMKQAYIQQKADECIAASKKVKAASIRVWVVKQQLECLALKKNLTADDKAVLRSALDAVEKNQSWLVENPYAGLIQGAYLEGLLTFFELQLKSDRKVGWRIFDRLQGLQHMMNVEQKAKLHRLAGELAFVEQNLMLAMNYFNRSLTEKESQDLRKRVESLKIALKIKNEDTSIKGEEKEVSVGVSEEELSLYNRFFQAQQSQELLSAVQDGVELIQKYPGSQRAQELTDKIQEIYSTMASRNEDKFRSLREQVIKEMVKVDGARLAKWAQFAYVRGYYLDALIMGEKAYAKIKGQPEATKPLMIAGRSALYTNEIKSAVNFFELLTKEHAGTTEAAEAHFRLGLIKYREKKDSEASAYFERLLALSAGKNFEYRTLYWYWRAQQRLGAEKSKDLAMLLIQKYPLTYYALKAKIEFGMPFFDVTPAPSIDVRMTVSDREKAAWDRFTLLAEHGWWNEAKAELDTLPLPLTNQDKIVRARLYRKIRRADQAIILMNQVWDDDPAMIRGELLKVVFPKDFAKQIQKESQAQKVDPLLVYSLIRQESAFRTEALSSSNAMGLMQIIPPTGQELAQDLKLKNYETLQLYQSDLNIRLGTMYIARLMRSFGGNVGYALASYNAGPTKVRRWMNFRPQMFDKEDDEIWIDELPWEETSFYVKAILRNLILYKAIFEEKKE